MKKIAIASAGLLSMAMVLGSTAGSAFASTTTQQSKGYVIALSNGFFGNTWRTQFLNDMTQVANSYQKQGIISKFIVNNASSDAQQIAAINSFIAQRVDAIVVVPETESALTPVIEKAIKQGIKVIAADDANWPGAVSVVNNNSMTMNIATQWMAEQLKGKGNIVYINGVPGTAFDNVRNAAVDSVLKKFPGIKIVGKAPGYWTDAKSNAAMTTLLSGNHKLNGVLEQDVMARGTLQAFKTAHTAVPPIIGDFVFGYLREWKSMPKLNTFTYTFPPGIGADGLKVAVKLLQGYKLKPSALSTNVLNPKLKNEVEVPIPYYVVRTVPKSATWMTQISPKSKVISLSQALKMGKGQSDNTAIDHVLSDKEISALFQSKK